MSENTLNLSRRQTLAATAAIGLVTSGSAMAQSGKSVSGTIHVGQERPKINPHIYGGFQETGTEIPPIFAVENRLPASTLAELRARGYTLNVIHSDEGSVNGVMRDPASGFLIGGADPRRWGSEGSWTGDAASVYAVGW